MKLIMKVLPNKNYNLKVKKKIIYMYIKNDTVMNNIRYII